MVLGRRVGQIAFITPNGHIQEIPFDSSGAAGGIVTGPDDNIWFTDLIGNSVWRLDLATRVLTSFPVPTPDAFPSDITVGSDGNLWFVEGVGKIGRITPQGVITDFGSGLSLPFSIATGPDGNVWFTQRFTPEIGKLTPDGDFTFYPIPVGAEEIAPGYADNLIYTEFGSSKIARITTDGVVTESPVIPDSQPTSGFSVTETTRCIGPRFLDRRPLPEFQLPLGVIRDRKAFGQIRALELRNSARFVQTARFAFSPVTRSLAHVCRGIAQSREKFQAGSNPVRVASLVRSAHEVDCVTVLHNKAAIVCLCPPMSL